MNDFRQRVVTPLALPLGVLVAILIFAFSLSRVFLAVPKQIAAVTAVGVAAYVLLVAFVVERRENITSRALAVGLTIGLAAVAGAGVAGAVAGPQPIEEEEAEPVEGAGGAGSEDPPAMVESPPEDAALFETPETDLAYTTAPDTIAAGEATIALTMTGNLEHNVVFEGVNDEEPIVDGTEGPGTYVGNVTLEAGSYTYYCSIAGHRAAGMEGSVEVQ